MSWPQQGPSVCLSVYPSIRPSARPSVRPPVHPSVHPSLRPSVRPAPWRPLPQAAPHCSAAVGRRGLLALSLRFQSDASLRFPSSSSSSLLLRAMLPFLSIFTPGFCSMTSSHRASSSLMIPQGIITTTQWCKYLKCF